MPTLNVLLKKVPLFALGVLCSFPLLAQSLKYTASPELLSTKSNYSMFSEFIGDDEQFVYVKTNKGFTNSRKNKIVILEKKSMSQVRELELNSDDDSRLLLCFAVKQTIYIFRVEKNEQGSELTGEILNSEFKTLGAKKNLRNSADPNHFFSLKVNCTTDKKALFVAVNTLVNSETKNIDLELQFFDSNLTSLQDKTFALNASLNLPDVANEYILHTDKLLPDGTVIVDIAIHGSQQKFVTMHSQSASYFYAYNYKDQDLIESFKALLPKSSKQYWPSDILSDGTSTYVAGIYYEESLEIENDELQNASGIFLSPLNTDITGSETIHLKFTAEFIEQLVSQNAEGPEAGKSLPIPDSPRLPFNNINFTHFRKDASGITLIFECVGEFHFNDYLGNIGIVHANLKGEISWSSKINRSSYAYSSPIQSEIMTLVKDNTLYFVYDNEIDEQTKKDRKKKLKKEGYIVDYTTLDLRNGKIQHHELNIPLAGFVLSDVASYRNFQIDQCNNQIFIQSFEVGDKSKKKGYYLVVVPG